MDNLALVMPQFITRTAFQNILHQALVAGKNSACFGLLGAANLDTIQHVAVIDCEAVFSQVLGDWNTLGITCIGAFSVVGDQVPSYLYSELSNDYTLLSVCLDEKGRLDLFAEYVSKGKFQKLNLNLIESGQPATDA